MKIAYLIQSVGTKYWENLERKNFMELQEFLNHANAGKTIETVSEYMMFSGIPFSGV